MLEPMSEQSNQVAITVAIIGVVGSLGAAAISNWDKIAQPRLPLPPDHRDGSESVKTPPPPPPPPPTPTPNLSGVWRDSVNPGNGSRVVQQGQTFTFQGWGTLPNGVGFQSTGTGSVDADRVSFVHKAQYQTGETSTGGCDGSVTSDASTITMSCTDTRIGAFPSRMYRQ